jgi:hypothetical protein
VHAASAAEQPARCLLLLVGMLLLDAHSVLLLVVMLLLPALVTLLSVGTDAATS